MYKVIFILPETRQKEGLVNQATFKIYLECNSLSFYTIGKLRMCYNFAFIFFFLLPSFLKICLNYWETLVKNQKINTGLKFNWFTDH